MTLERAMEYWLVTVPAHRSGSDARGLRDALESARAVRYFSGFSLPPLPVSSLDTLLSLSDALARSEREIEGVCKRIEKQFVDCGGGREPLLVDGVPRESYIENFEWNYAKFSVRADVRLSDVAEEVRRGVAAADEEVRGMAADLSETQQSLASLKRRKTGGIATAPLEEFLTAEMVDAMDGVSSEYLVTLVAIVPKAVEADWLQNYARLGRDLAGFGGPDYSNGALPAPGSAAGAGARGSRRGSPVLPGSSRRVCEHGDASVYSLTALRGQYQAGFYSEEEPSEWVDGVYADFLEPLKAEAREMRVTLRDLDFDASRVGEGERALEELQISVDVARTDLLERCRVQFAEVFEALAHAKVLRAFVESVLRYGLVQGQPGERPQAKFAGALIRPERQEKRARDALAAFFERFGHGAGMEGEGEGDGDDDEEYTNYVCVRFPLGIKG